MHTVALRTEATMLPPATPANLGRAFKASSAAQHNAPIVPQSIPFLDTTSQYLAGFNVCAWAMYPPLSLSAWLSGT